VCASGEDVTGSDDLTRGEVNRRLWIQSLLVMFESLLILITTRKLYGLH